MHNFDRIWIHDLDLLDAPTCDALPYGVIGLGRDGLVEVYNTTEAEGAGLQAARIMGGHFFDSIAQCMNNFMVAQRFEDEPELDATIDFVLTLRMRPTPVRLRLLQSASVERRYILVDRTIPTRA